jgi:CubicO group peptidase (beta-lactamase class C family)
MNRQLFPLLLIALLGTGQLPAQDPSAGALDAYFQGIFPADAPGGAVLIARHGQVVFAKGFGLSDMHTRDPITTRTLFNLGSISKTFVAYGILKLADEKRLSLDDPIGKYFPAFKNKEIAQKVKVYHLLTHSSGLPDNRKVKEDSVFYLTAKDAENFAPIMENETLRFEPGEQFEYSNPAFNGLALIIEQVTRMKWQDYIRELILQTAGMRKSTITDGAWPDKGVSHAYLFDGKNYLEKDYGEEPTFAAAGNGGVWSNVEEMWRYEQAVQEHKFISPSWTSMSRTVYPLKNWKGSTPPFIGLSWFITHADGIPQIGHTGSQGGFISDYLWVPDQEFFYVLLCNTPKDIMDIRARVFAICGIKNKSRDQ